MPSLLYYLCYWNLRDPAQEQYPAACAQCLLSRPLTNAGTVYDYRLAWYVKGTSMGPHRRKVIALPVQLRSPPFAP